MKKDTTEGLACLAGLVALAAAYLWLVPDAAAWLWSTAKTMMPGAWAWVCSTAAALFHLGDTQYILIVLVLIYWRLGQVLAVIIQARDESSQERQRIIRAIENAHRPNFPI